jgi:MFS family permease
LVPFPIYLAGLGIADWEVAIILGSSAIASLLIRPFSGILSDVRERREVMFLGAVALAIGAIGVASTTLVASLIGFRVLQAAGYVVFTTSATATIANLAKSGNRASSLAVYGIAANIAITIIPLSVASALSGEQVLGTFMLSGVLAGICGFIALTTPLIPSSSSVHRLGWLDFFRVPVAIRVPMLATLLFGVGFGTFLQFLPLLATKRGLGGIGSTYTVYGIGIVLTRLFTRRTLDGRYRGEVMLGATVAMSFGLIVFAFAASDFPLLLGASAMALGSGILHPALIATHVERMPVSEYGRAAASFYLAFDLGIGMGAWGLSPALQWWGITGLFVVAAFLSFSSVPLLKNLGKNYGMIPATILSALSPPSYVRTYNEEMSSSLYLLHPNESIS